MKTKTKKIKSKPEEDRSLDSISIWSSDSKFSSFVIPTLAIIIIVSVIGLGWFAMQAKNSSQELRDMKVSIDSLKKSYQLDKDELEAKLSKFEKEAEDKAKEEEAAALKNEKGFIEGSLGYPSNYIPQDMKICAINLDTEEEYCTTEQVYDKKYTYTMGYKIEVPVGSYNVYSSVTSQGDYKAYYSDFVTCGLGYNCKSHTPIKVTVAKDTTTDKVDPTDWYNK